ncbi:MAG: sulfotransferase [Rhodospirillales bacterium]|nr:sulfotransferase [Rhodospirillales bacterium]
MTTDAARPDLIDIDDVLHEANQAHTAGDLVTAERGYRSVLAAAPGHFAALNLLGVLFLQTGRLAGAVAHLRRAVALRPSEAEARKNLGIAYELSGDLARAAGQYERATVLQPRLAAAHFGLGVCHEHAGRPDAAVACYRRAATLAPDHAPAHNNLGSLLSDSDPAAAEAALRRAIALDPGYPEPLNNLGALMLSLGRAQDACAPLEQAVALRPGYADAMTNLGAALCTLGRAEQGMDMLRAAIAADPAALVPRWTLAATLAERGAAAEAENVLRGVLALAPDHPETRMRLGQMLYQLGRFAEAERLLAPLLGAGDRRGNASFAWVQTRRLEAADRGVVAGMQTLADDTALPDEERIPLLFALGKACHDLGDPAAAMRQYDAANALKRAQMAPFDRAAHAAFVDRLIATYTPELFRARRSWASESRRPLLIVGMMRSGTTLLEQMLAAHPAVAAGGELTFWPLHGRSGDVLPADAAAARALTDGYTAELDRIAPDSRHVTDKLPHNVYALGLIHMLFPHARILHCRRAPADVGLSIYRTLFFAPHDFAYEQGDIAFLLRTYERLAAHWRAVLPPQAMTEVQYETLVAAPEGTARRLLAFCGLDWDPLVLDHAAHGRMIRTASAWQARQPVYTDSAGLARRYRPWLGELASLLADDGG